jgi:ketol-acid reductoisomerase
MDPAEFDAGVEPLASKKLVIIGCGAQGFNQGLNLRDSGLNVAYALRKEAIEEKRPSWVKATEAGFQVGTYEEMVPEADMVLNLTPDKQHTNVVQSVMPLMKQGACLSYSHGFNIVEEGMKIREGSDRHHGCAQMPGHRGARGISPRLRRADPDCRSPRK